MVSLEFVKALLSRRQVGDRILNLAKGIFSPNYHAVLFESSALIMLLEF